MQTDGPGKKPFTQMYNTLKPGLFESGQYVHGGEEGGNRVYYAHGSLMPNGRGEDALARLEGAKLVKRAMVDQYGSGELVRRALAKVSGKAGRVLDEGITRGDVELLHQELSKTTFTGILEQFKSDLPDKGGEHVRGEDTKDVKRVYIHDSFKPHGTGLDYAGLKAIKAREAKYEVGAKLIRRTMINEYGEAVADAALAVVKKTRDRIEKEVLLSDLEPLHQELQKQQQKMESTAKTTFTEIWGRYDLGVFGTDEGKDPLMPRGRWAEVLARRQEKPESGAEFLMRAITNEYGPDAAVAVLAEVSKKRPPDRGLEITPDRRRPGRPVPRHILHLDPARGVPSAPVLRSVGGRG